MLVKIVLALALASTQLAVHASNLPDYPFVHVNGTGAVKVMPDVGEIVFDVSARDASAEAARAVVETRVGEIRALLVQQSVPEQDIEIRDVQKEIRKAEGAAPDAAVVQVKCGVHIKVRALEKWRDIVGPLLDMPNLDNFGTAFDATEYEKIEAEVMAQALAVARRKAEGLVAGFGRRLGPVSAVSTGELKNITRALGLAASDDPRSRNGGRSDWHGDAFLQIRALKLAQAVDVIFRIK